MIIQPCRTNIQDHKIVNIAIIILRLERVFHKMIQFVKINIRKKLAGQVPNGKPTG
jgi:hypothetical protein